MSKFDEVYQQAVSARAGKKGRFIKPEKARDLLLKIRKNATASVSWSQLMDILEIFGWEISIYPTFVKMYGSKDEPERTNYESSGYGEASTLEWRLGNLKAKREKLLKGLVARLPKTATPGEHYILEIGEISALKDGFFAFEFRDWAGAWGIKFTSPGGASIGYDPEDSDILHNNKGSFLTGKNEPLPADFAPLDFKISRAIYKNDEFRAAVIEALEMEEHEPSAPRTVENSGTCGYCFRNIKLSRDGGTHMVLHGYKRPGWGHTVGNCKGIHHGPFELTSSGTEARLVDETNALNYYLKQVNIIEGRGDKVVFMSTYGLPYSREKQEPRAVDSSMADWKHIRSNALSKLKAQVSLAQDSVNLFEALISSWKRAPLPQVGVPHKNPLLKVERKHNAENGLRDADVAK